MSLNAGTVAACVTPVFESWPVRCAWMFGSVARGTQTGRSDVDIMVELEDGASLGFSFLVMEDEVSDALGCDVHLNTLVRARSTPAFLEAFDRDKVMVYERKAR